MVTRVRRGPGSVRGCGEISGQRSGDWLKSWALVKQITNEQCVDNARVTHGRQTSVFFDFEQIIKKAKSDSDVMAGAECDKDYLFLQDLTV